METLDIGLLATIKFSPSLHRDGSDAPNLINVVLQSYKNKQVLFSASMNKEALSETISTGLVTLYSQSRNCLWRKGESSGNRLKVISIYLNCDHNQLLIMVETLGKGVCHEVGTHGNHRPTCFSRLIMRME